MSTNKTQNYNLHSWLGGDNFLRTEINENFTALDTVLSQLAAEKARAVAGVYTGDGTAERTIPLGFPPQAVLVIPGGTRFQSDGYTHDLGLAILGHPIVYNGSYLTGNVLVLVSNGFSVYYKSGQGGYSISTNRSGTLYHYIALG